MKWKALRAPHDTPQTHKGWMYAIIGACLALFGVVIVRLAVLQIFRHDELSTLSARQHRVSVQMSGIRGSIVDRHQRPLAISSVRTSISLNPKKLENPQATLDALTPLIPIKASVRTAILEQKKTFVWLKRQAEPELAEAIQALNIEGIRMEPEAHRTYPNGPLAGPLLGFTDIDDKGQAGLERDFEPYLAGKKYAIGALRANGHRIGMTNGSVPMEQISGSSLELSIDSRIQQIAETALQNQIEEMDAQSGAVVVMDPHSGDILAMAQTPNFDPNHPTSVLAQDRENKVLTHVLEPGSIIKPLLVAGALDAGKVRTDTVFPGYNGSWRINNRKVVRDSHPIKEMTTLEVLKYSSNIGAIQVGQRMGKELYHSYLRAFGLGESTGLHRSESSGSLAPPRKWGQIHLATISYGYGITVTPLQMARAYSAIANGGLLIQPRLVTRITDARGQTIKEFPERVLRRVISEKAAKEVTKGLVMVTSEGGTGKRGRVHGYTVAGKTGTAHMVDSTGNYAQNRVRASFAGFVPAEDPRLVIVITIEDPSVSKYGGTVSAPVFSAIAREALPYLGVQATTDIDGSSDEGEEEEIETPIELAAQARPWWFTDSAIGDHQLVPEVRGMPLSQALEELAPLGFQIHVEGQGAVAEQTPQAGALLPQNAEIHLRLSLVGEIHPLETAAAARRATSASQKKARKPTHHQAAVATTRWKPTSIHPEDEDLP